MVSLNLTATELTKKLSLLLLGFILLILALGAIVVNGIRVIPDFTANIPAIELIKITVLAFALLILIEEKIREAGFKWDFTMFLGIGAMIGIVLLILTKLLNIEIPFIIQTEWIVYVAVFALILHEIFWEK